ncbi:MAG: hypothetical protein A2070_07675 [Bdellovibrionales bacterium GWC1_52_8]|nr:MAG: hypothetical protein A2Z97_16005 [Bdellovibrionales bacterium GWB1_52_6]OFZ03068.1 MAG: hypothetical protein A2X97_09505 [Bdellovibrionales bacterium GWA1_52_35]OFZ43297.1 MAG: hypothetical protein A2070_07675 [Bdellovibrionales bacterium GWC1_52_8]HCM40393.1 hypothetical protein [Bdellovibrionales bacterium]
MHPLAWFQQTGAGGSGRMNDSNLTSSLILLAALLILGTAYLIRVLMKGRATFERVNQQGGSVFLSKNVMEMAYWGLGPLARFFVFLRISANMLTWSALGLGFISAACLASGNFGFAALFTAGTGFLDALDGMVARLTGKIGKGGEILDSAIDRCVEFMFIGGVVLYYRDIPSIQVIALSALLGSFLVSYSTAKAEAFRIEVPRGAMRRPERAVILTFGALISPITILSLESERLLARPVAHPMVVALVLVALFANLSAIERFKAIAQGLRAKQPTQP